MVKLSVKLVEDKLIIQKVYGTNLDFDKTLDKLKQRGYRPKHFSAGRIRKDGLQQEEAGNLVFYLKSGIKVNIPPKKDLFYKIQITWNNWSNPKIKEKQLLQELSKILIPEDEKLFIISLRTNKNKIGVENDDEILDKLSMKGLI